MSGTIEFSEDFEGGSNGTTISTSNTGFSSVNLTSATATFDNSTAEHGILSAKLLVTGPGGLAGIYHNFPAAESNVFARWAIYLPAAPFVNASIGLMQVAGTAGAYLQLGPGGQLLITQNGAAFSAATGNGVPTATWTLIEWNVNSGASTQTLRLYSGLTGAPIETISCGYNIGTPLAAALYLQAVSAYSYNADNYSDAFDDWVGPLSVYNGVAANIAWAA